MLDIWIYSLVSVVLVSLMSLMGVFTISLKVEELNKFLIYMVSFAAGAMLGDVFIHLLPEIFETQGFTIMVSIYILSGVGVAFVIEKIIYWRHCHIAPSEDHKHPFAIMNLVGDSVHNFIDGMLIGISYLVSIPVGIATTTAVLLHEIPQEISDFGVLIQGGFSKSRALLFNFLTAVTAVFGAILALLLGSSTDMFSKILLPLTAGIFIYIAGSDLIPELHKETKITSSILQLIFLVLGVVVMLLLTLLD